MSDQLERELLDRYRKKRDAAMRDLADAQARVTKYDLAVKGMEAVLDEEPEQDAGSVGEREGDADRPLHPPSEFPRGEKAVALLLDEFGELSIQNLTKLMLERGAIAPDAKHPESATRQALNRLRRKDPKEYDLVRGKAVKLKEPVPQNALNLMFRTRAEALIE